jgi:hypothetical protein
VQGAIGFLAIEGQAARAGDSQTILAGSLRIR